MLVVLVRELDTSNGLRSYVYKDGIASIVIGRDLGSDIVLPSNKVSKRHAVIQSSVENITLCDAGSTNGTYINGTQLISNSPSPIHYTDRLGIGNYVLQISPSAADKETTKRMDAGESSHLIRQMDPSIANIQVPSAWSLRQIMKNILVGDSDFDAFCIDFFPKVQRRFSSGMDRVAKENILLIYANRYNLLMKLRTVYPQQVARQENLIEYESQE